MGLEHKEESEVIEFARTKCSHGTTAPPLPHMLKTCDRGPPPPPSRPEFIVLICPTHRDQTVLCSEVDTQKIEQVPPDFLGYGKAGYAVALSATAQFGKYIQCDNKFMRAVVM
jgi:hypothetical protein